MSAEGCMRLFMATGDPVIYVCGRRCLEEGAQCVQNGA